ncbi:unnamed protein product, partial [Mesorhabditis spiculigera]
MDPEGPGKSSDGEPNEQQRPEEQENVQPGSDVTKPAEGDILDQGVTFDQDKPAENSRNVYDPSFKAIYCNGCVWDPLKKDDAMAMCVLCENWFHYAHTGLQGIAEDDGADLICRSCVTKHPWFAGKYIQSGAAPASEQITAVLIGPSEDWRKDLCTCDACQRILENDEVEFLTNPDDLLSTYENEIGVEEERAKEARSGEEIILEIANRHNLDRESSVMALQAYGELKEHLREFFSTVNENGGEVVTGEMVARFFAEKRARRRPEWTTSATSYLRIRDGVALLRDGISPYEGDFFHTTPIVLFFFNRIVDIFSPLLIVTLSVAVDITSALLLATSARYFGEDSNTATAVLKCYLLNPLAIGSCATLGMTTFHNFFLAAFVYVFSAGCPIFATLILTATISLQLYPITLFASVWLRFPGAMERVKATVALLIGLAGITLLNYVMAGYNWAFLEDVYGHMLRYDDLRPNCGWYWYFFTQVFDHFRQFYIYVFQANTMLYVLPLTLSLRSAPKLHLILSLLLLAVFAPYPTLGDAAVYMALLPLLHHLFPLMRQALAIGATVVTCVALMPVMWHLWAVSGSGNANFYFAVTLIYNLAQVFLLTDIIMAHFRLQVTATVPETINEKTIFIMN